MQGLSTKYGFRLLRKDNGGQGSARNAGVAACGADYICFLDQDDLFKPEHIEILVNSIPSFDDRFGFNYAELDEIDASSKQGRHGMVKRHGNHPKRDWRDMLRNDMFILPSASIISRKAFSAVGGFDEQFTGFEDDDLFMRVILAGYSHDFIDSTVTDWRIHDQSTSYSVLMIRSRLRYFKKLMKSFPDDIERKSFYFRDDLVPRFERRFLGDAIRASIAESPDKQEIFAILREYAVLVYQHPSICISHRLGLKIRIIFIKMFSKNILNIIFILRKPTSKQN